MSKQKLLTGAMACAVVSNLFLAGILLAGAAGCATPKPSLHTEELLQSSGFRIVTATTPAEKAQLQTLRPGKLTIVHRNGKAWYVYPDAAHDQLYVGNLAQYQAYRQAYQDQQMVRGQVDSVLLHEDSVSWDFGGLDFGQ